MQRKQKQKNSELTISAKKANSYNQYVAGMKINIGMQKRKWVILLSMKCLLM